MQVDLEQVLEVVDADVLLDIAEAVHQALCMESEEASALWKSAEDNTREYNIGLGFPHTCLMFGWEIDRVVDGYRGERNRFCSFWEGQHCDTPWWGSDSSAHNQEGRRGAVAALISELKEATNAKS
jgi:hypothetical protein